MFTKDEGEELCAESLFGAIPEDPTVDQHDTGARDEDGDCVRFHDVQDWRDWSSTEVYASLGTRVHLVVQYLHLLNPS